MKNKIVENKNTGNKIVENKNMRNKILGNRNVGNKNFGKKILGERNLRNFFLENKAQAGAVFRLLIDAIIGLVILLAILSALSYFEQQQLSLSTKEFESFLVSIVNSPDGKIIESPALTFNKGTMYNTTSFEALTQHPRDCFFIQSGLGSIKVTDKRIVEFSQRIQVTVYGQCEPSFSDECPYFCIVSFGKKIID